MTALNKLFEVVDKSNAGASRVSDNVNAFVDQFKNTELTEIAFKEERDNDIFNRGVVAGATNLLDNLQHEGYSITTADGEVVKTEPAVGDEPAKTFSQTYFTTNWSDVNT